MKERETESMINNEIIDLMNRVFPTSESRVGGKDSTFQRVTRLMLLAEKLAMTVAIDNCTKAIVELNDEIETTYNPEEEES